MLSNDIKCEYMFMFPLNNLARKELIPLWKHATRGLSDDCHIMMSLRA